MKRVLLGAVVCVLLAGCGATASPLTTPPTATASTTVPAIIPSVAASVAVNATPMASPTPVVSPTPAPIDLAAYQPLIREFQRAIANRDRNALRALFGVVLPGEESGLLWAGWGRGQGAGAEPVAGTDSTLEAFFALPELRVAGIVQRNDCRQSCAATGLLLDDWQSRPVDFSVFDIPPSVPPKHDNVVLRGSAIVIVFHLDSEPPFERNRMTTFFGLAPADGFVKIADTP